MKFSNLSKHLDVVTNVVVLASSMATLAFLVLYGARLLPRRQDVTPQTVAVGDRLAVPGVDWSAKDKTLLFVMQTGCSHCTASAPAFRELASEAATLGNVGVFAIFPQEQDGADSYLKSLNLPLPLIRMALATIHVRGTPTVLLCDRTGRVQEFWVGELNQTRTSMILNSLTRKG